MSVTSVTSGGPLSNTICLRLNSVDFHHFHHYFCQHGVLLKNRKAIGLTASQSSVLCDLHVEYVDCTKIWSSSRHHRYACGVTSLAPGSEISNGCIAETRLVFL